MGNSNEMCRKIMNSPNHAEPCIVAAAKKVLLPTNWVFLHGKAHSDYRRALNVLFTKQALRWVECLIHRAPSVRPR
jgi:C-22 sterol desaturase